MPRTKSEGKRQEILDAAEAAFGRREFDEVTTDDIAVRAGVEKGRSTATSRRRRISTPPRS